MIFPFVASFCYLIPNTGSEPGSSSLIKKLRNEIKYIRFDIKPLLFIKEVWEMYDRENRM
jgi:hypothetical protein